MNYFSADQKTIPLGKSTVADVIKALQKCPQNAPLCNADGDSLLEITIFTDGDHVSVEIY
jgi:hypothetical protein